MNRYEFLKKKKKPDPFLTGFLLETDSINPKFLVKQEIKEVKKQQNIPKVVMEKKDTSNNIDNINQPRNNENQEKPQNDNISSQKAKDINDIFDIFSNNLSISNNKEQKSPFDNANQQNPNGNMINNNSNFIDINSFTGNNNKNKPSEENPQNKRLNNLEELLKDAYANNPNDNNNNVNYLIK